jgi:uncharacterized protein with PIN domain
VPRLLVAPELRFFLPKAHRAAGALDVSPAPHETLGHVVETVGIPLPEVGELRLGGALGRVVPPGHRFGSPDPVDVHVLAPPRPQPLGGPPAFLLDVHLGALARRLRLLGLDVAYRNDAADEELVAQANAADRLLLTQDRGLLRRRALRRAAFVRGSAPDAQLADVLDRFALPVAPYTRCPVCGDMLHDVPKADVLDELEPGTRRTQHRFWRCAGCRRVYWHGAHAARLDAMLRAALRKGGPGEPGGPGESGESGESGEPGERCEREPCELA